MLRSLLKGVGMGAGMGIGQEIAGTVIQNLANRRRAGNAGNAAEAVPEELGPDVQCGGCGEINTADSKFCGECGNSLMCRINLQAGVRCGCGYMNAKGQKFCSECGSKM